MAKYCFALVMVALLSACAGTSTVRDAPLGAGTERSFDAHYDAVAAATLDAVRSLNVSITGTEDKPEGLVILVAKPVSPMSWGEVGRVTVVPSDGPNTSVRVYWEKRSRMQVTGTSESEFAERLYASIYQNLAAGAK